MRGLKSLDLSETGLGDNGCLVLVAALDHAEHLTSLSLAGNGITDRGMKVLEYVFKSVKKLKTFDFGNNSLTESGCHSMVKAMEKAGLSRLLHVNVVVYVITLRVGILLL